MDIENRFMARCIFLAGHGRACTAPNPMVGAVVALDGQIIGEGFHQRHGGAHAEVNAVEAVAEPSQLRKATLYVNLEPCSHFGKTPPCTELIIRTGIPRVIVATEDPFADTAGRGISILRQAGVEVLTGMMRAEAEELNRYFLTAHRLHRPYIILKWAQSQDGFIDKHRTNALEKPVKLSSTLTRMEVHKLRSEVQAIMVGSNTALLDNPSLGLHHWSGEAPLRVLTDRRRRIPSDYRIFNNEAETVVFPEYFLNEDVVPPKKAVVHTISDSAPLKPSSSTCEPLETILSTLYSRHIHSLLVEGGAQLHRSFIEAGLWDEIIIETAPFCLHEGVKAAPAGNVKKLNSQKIPFFPRNNEKQATITKYRHFDESCSIH